jgi:hypothetical protein
MTGLITVILLAVALMHASWGLQVWWPLRDEAALARAFVGAKGVTRMPGAIPCFGVAGALAVLAAALWWPHLAAVRVLLWAAVVVFALRAVLAYVPLWRRMTPEQPFARNDQRYFGPLCLALALGIFLILQQGV